MGRKVTLTIDEELLDRARILAARHKISVSALLRDALTRLLFEDEAYESAKRAALDRLDRGTCLGGGPLAGREALHDRARLR